MNVRQALSDNAIKDTLSIEDIKFLREVRSTMEPEDTQLLDGTLLSQLMAPGVGGAAIDAMNAYTRRQVLRNGWVDQRERSPGISGATELGIAPEKAAAQKRDIRVMGGRLPPKLART